MKITPQGGRFDRPTPQRGEGSVVGVVSMVGCMWETTGDEALAGSLAESNTKRQLRRGKKAKAWDMSDYGTKADPKR